MAHQAWRIESRAAAILLAMAAAVPAPAWSQLVGPTLPRVIEPRNCPEPDPNSDEIVVCGRGNDENSPYRIPRELRERRNQIEDRNMSWDARNRDMEAMERFSSANVGPSGMSQNSRRQDCEWRAARQEAQGRQPDCGRRSQPDRPTDWQRR
jgi:hypothetical protein